ncbi:hypothetical protein [Singulisphaera acidiphila]|uniref:Uncharacterized protein n=1 Tax=Singulisphaera acidiphila (strain ATCC BAA-1392 / DSM 18658 / VKM B-2454 / MOB10) TaxID=886293 RepID=L0DBZ1_SINAD|nr:hypothetical protein [Singulisphaera acidiphila]AGA26762.1 hypothetical protein Sinac_2452 [Singulisphaera acidiphila DSM 18658]
MERIHVRLSDGETWSLAVGAQSRKDPELDALLAAAIDVEDQSEALRAELSLTIFLLRRNYELNPDELALLLTFTPDDPALSALQNAVHDLVVERIQSKRGRQGCPQRRTGFLADPI